MVERAHDEEKIDFLKRAQPSDEQMRNLLQDASDFADNIR
jgi:hypothetical protein